MVTHAHTYKLNASAVYRPPYALGSWHVAKPLCTIYGDNMLLSWHLNPSVLEQGEKVLAPDGVARPLQQTAIQNIGFLTVGL